MVIFSVAKDECLHIKVQMYFIYHDVFFELGISVNILYLFLLFLILKFIIFKANSLMQQNVKFKIEIYFLSQIFKIILS